MQIMRLKRYKWLIVALPLLVGAAFAQKPQETGTLQVRGYPGEATVIRVNGRPFVDLEALMRITGSSVAFENGYTVLTLAPGENPASCTGSKTVSGFSHPFMAAASRHLQPCASGAARFTY